MAPPVTEALKLAPQSMFAPEPEAQLPAVQAAPAQRPNIALVHSAEPKSYPPKIAKALLKVTKAIGPIAKNGKNTDQNYFYQKWEDILDVISPLLTDNEIIIMQSEVSRSTFENNGQLMSITYQFTIINGDGDVWPDRPIWTAISKVRFASGSVDDKAANKCHTQAHKYFLLHLFKIKANEVKDDSDASDEAADTKKPPAPGTPAAKIDPAAPHTITAEGHTAQSWTAAYIDKLALATTAEQVEGWQNANPKARGNIEQSFPAEHQRIVKATTDAVARVNKPAAAAASTTKKPPAPGGMKPPAPTTSAPAKPTAPDPNTHFEEFKTWMDGKLALIEVGSAQAENYEELWNDNYAPLIDRLNQFEQEEVLGIYDKHYRRLAP